MYKDELGRASWKFLHTIAKGYPQNPSAEEKHQMSKFIDYFGAIYPCGECRAHFKKLRATRPKRLESRTQLRQYFCTLHNDVNRRLGKPLYDCSKLK